MRATRHIYLLLLDLIAPVISMKSASCEAPHYLHFSCRHKYSNQIFFSKCHQCIVFLVGGEIFLHPRKTGDKINVRFTDSRTVN